MNDRKLSIIKTVFIIEAILLIAVISILIMSLYTIYTGSDLPNYLKFLTKLNSPNLLFYLFGVTLLTYGFYGDEMKRRQVAKWKKDNAGKNVSSGLSKTGKLIFLIAILIILYVIYLGLFT